MHVLTMALTALNMSMLFWHAVKVNKTALLSRNGKQIKV